MPGAMPLNQAIERVLEDAGTPMHADDIADEINRRGLYSRGDERPLQGSQVRARIAKPEYRDGFVVRDGIVSPAWLGR